MAVRPDVTDARQDGYAARPGGPGTVRGMLSLEELKQYVEQGAIDTVVAAFTDMQGRLMGKRIQAEFFLEDVLSEGIEGCNYLLALDMEMDPVPGYAMANWEGGYGDFRITPDLATLRRIPWLEGTALVLCDVALENGNPVVASPRQILIEQYQRAHALGYLPMFASELEFYLYRESCASTFIQGHDETDVFRHYLGGLRAHVKELALMVAPTVNSYKRYALESWAPTSVSWGRDNRTCGFRVVGHGQGHRVECRIPGADVNPYLGFAALLAAGLAGIENSLDPGPELKGNAYAAGAAKPFPYSLSEAVDNW